MENLSLADIVSFIESRGRLSAIRFEPTVYNKFVDPKNVPKAAALIVARIVKANNCSNSTAAMIYSSSFGKYQVMGFNIYADDDFTMPVGEFLGCQSAQDARFTAFLKRNGLGNYTGTQLAHDQAARLNFAIKYNGSIAYVNNIIAALKYFGVEPK